MLSKLMNLTQNELMKQFKKKGVKVMFALTLIIAILLPIGINLIPDTNYTRYSEEGNKYLLQNTQSMITQYEQDKTATGKIYLALAQADLESIQLEIDAKIGFDDWRQKEVQDYKMGLYKIVAMKQIMDGVSLEVVLDNMYNITTEEMTEFDKLTSTKQQEKFNEVLKEKEESKSIIINHDYMNYLKKHVVKLQKQLEAMKKEMETKEKELVKDPTNAELKQLLENIKESIKIDEELLKISQYRIDHEINFETTNWKHNTIKAIEKAMMKLQQKLMSEEEYSNEAGMRNLNMTYQTYKENFEQNQQVLKEEITQNWYSLKQGIPQLEYVKDARSVTNGVYEIYVMLATVIVIIIGGGIVSSEFSKGTIRLLLIRPVSRGKILASKLITLLIIGYSVMFGALAISLITSGVIYGFNTLQIPVLETMNGAIGQGNFIFYIISNLLVSSVSFLFITSIVFTISTIFKNTAVAVALSLVLYLGAMPLTMLLASANMTWIGETFIPFINQSFFNLSPMSVEMLKTQQGITLNSVMGISQLAILSIVMLLITFRTFIKKDIQN